MVFYSQYFFFIVILEFRNYFPINLCILYLVNIEWEFFSCVKLAIIVQLHISNLLNSYQMWRLLSKCVSGVKLKIKECIADLVLALLLIDKSIKQSVWVNGLTLHPAVFQNAATPTNHKWQLWNFSWKFLSMSSQKYSWKWCGWGHFPSSYLSKITQTRGPRTLALCLTAAVRMTGNFLQTCIKKSLLQTKSIEIWVNSHIVPHYACINFRSYSTP